MRRVRHVHPQLLSALLCSAVLACGARARAATLFDPALRFRALTTEHFVIYFHQGAQPLAMRLAPIAEETWRALARPMGVTPPRLTRVVLADQTELANGYATPLPRDTIVIFTTWPGGVETLGETDDFLRLAFTHEFTHIVHLDRSVGWAQPVRAIFGRSPIAFPNLLLPTWQIEGLAVYEESAITGEGRLHAGDFRAIVGEAARQHALEPLDRVNGGLTDWPGGTAAYAYGLGFHRYLADRFGAESLGNLADATAHELPYFGSRAFKSVYGESLGDLWREYEAAEAASVAAAGTEPVTRVTHDGFNVTGPRFDRFLCLACPPEVLYAADSPHGFPSMKRVRLDGTRPVEVTRRYLGDTTAFGRERIYFDQLEVARNVGLYGDLYMLDRSSGRVVRLTSGARLTQPDLSRNERWLAAVQERVGARALVRIALERPDRAGAIETLLLEPDTQFNAPRWSPDGRSIAVERHRLGGLSEIIVVDVDSRNVRVVASIAGARVTTPTWTPDGRFLVAAVAPEDQPFNLFEFDAVTRAARQLTHTTGGATWPDVSPNGRTIAFVGYGVDGFDVFTEPYPAASPSTIPPLPVERPSRAPAPEQPTTDYSPLDTLAPTSWSPVVDSSGSRVRVGGLVSGYDLLGYHYYAASVEWMASAPADAVLPTRARPDWSAAYAYDRWQPTLFVSASRQTSFFAGPPTEAGAASPGTLVERELAGGIVFPIVHTRLQHAAAVSLVYDGDEYTLTNAVAKLDRTHARFAWTTVTAHTYGYSISAEDGVSIGATADFARTRPLAGSSGSSGSAPVSSATIGTVDARLYLRGPRPHHVIAIRGGIGASAGDEDSARTFLLGGPGPNTSTVSTDSEALSLLRGFPPDSFAGTHVAVLNADYRFPIARPQRGYGTWPLFLHTLHGAVFADAGQVWVAKFGESGTKTSIGAELSADLIAGYYFPLTIAAGAALGRDHEGSAYGGAAFYVRVGRSF
ncbi:MAG TPA: hypothetical protein VEU08_12385 [Vicinamibacterales bacterium]|nr:hypothetical protein [Vicinamibacterales bacterium]